MKLGNREFELIHRQNKAQVLEALPTKGYGFKYLEFLVDRDYDIAENFLDALLQYYSRNNSFKADFLEVASKLKISKGKVPEKIIKYLTDYLSPATLVEYPLNVLSADNEIEIEKEVMDKILNDRVAVHRFVSMALDADANIPLDPKMFEMIKEYPELCMKVALTYLKYGMKEYKDLDKNLIEGIARKSSVAERFAHLIQPYVDETPAEILDAVENQSKIKPKWHKGMNENFSIFFSKTS